jgi:tRNA(Ile)-lysidine synthase
MTQSLEQAMRGFQPVLPLGVALSGGADSCALLVLCARQWPGQVAALHINHGLQAAAPEFQEFCWRLCASLQVPLRVKAVQARPVAGQSPEDAARIARYQGLVDLAKGQGVNAGQGVDGVLCSVAVAQHADDQVETLLLALSRGSGLAGLSAMPAQWTRDAVRFHRPLLQVAGATVRAWLVDQQIAFVEDPTNTDARYTRNRVRAMVSPALQAAFPQYRDTFARSAAHAAQAQSLLDDIAREDVAHLLRARDGLPSIAGLQALGRARQANTLRFWLKADFCVIPSAAQLRELQDQLLACTTRGHRIHIKVANGFVERRGAVLAWYNPVVLPHRN